MRATSSGEGTRLFGLAVSVWPIRFGRFGLSCFGLAVSVWPFRSGRFGLAVSVTGLFGLETFRSGYEILQKSYMFTFWCKRT